MRMSKIIWKGSRTMTSSFITTTRHAKFTLLSLLAFIVALSIQPALTRAAEQDLPHAQPVPSDKPVNFRYGHAPDRVGFSESGWFPDNKNGHATDHQNEFDFAHITIGLTDNFIRSYLFGTQSYPGMRTPGTITFRLRRRGDSSKIILQSNGKGITTYLQKDPDADRYQVTGLVQKEPVYWGSRAAIEQWHDFTIQFDGQKRFLIIDHDPKQTYELIQSATPHQDHLSLGMGYEYGKDMYIDVESVRFTPQDQAEPAVTPSPRNDGQYATFDKQQHKIITSQFVNHQLQGPFTRYYPGGQKQTQGQYNKSQRDGLWIWWYPDGQERMRVQYQNAKLQGQYLRYYPNGQIETATQYDNDQANGLHVRWFPNGDTKLIGGYNHNVMDGPWISWNVNHKTQWAHMASNGLKDIYLKTWYPDGTPKLDTGYDMGQLDGLYTEHHSNGQIKTQGHYHKGQKIGEWITKDKNGKTLTTEQHPTQTKP